MVEQMVSSNLSKYGLGKYPNIISSSSDNQPVADVQNDNNAPRPFEDSILQKEEAVKSPPSGSSNVNRNLVYARRKSDAELTNSQRTRITTGYQQLGDKNHTSQIPNEQIPVNSTMVNFRNCEKEQATMVNSLHSMDHWNARFAQLHKYLKQCDNSNQEVYLQKLRSFSPDECSRHAVELEKRAIKLTFDEGNEMQRVKDLNVLGKSSGNHVLVRPAVFKSENMV